MLKLISKAAAKLMKPQMKPGDLFAKLAEEAGGHIGGTIRDGSSDERFALGTLVFNIEQARKIAGDKANSTVAVSSDWSIDINVSPSHALRGSSERPVFIAMIPTEDGLQSLLIDGHHRMYRAVNDKEKSIPAFTFTPEQVLTFLEAPPDMMSQIETNLRAQNAGKVTKSDLGLSSVHVNTPDWSTEFFKAVFPEFPVDKDALTSTERNDLHDKTFALPDERKYPIPDISHARNALARVAQHGSEEDKKKVRAAVHRKFPSLAVEKDQPMRVLSGAGNGENSMDGIYSMAQIVSGMDWELEGNGLSDLDTAREAAQNNLMNDSDFYRKKWLEANSSADPIDKDTQETEDSPLEGTGLNIDLGSGQCRQSGAIGVDLYPYDHGTVVHDMELGLPFLDDESCDNVRLSNVPEVDPEGMMDEVARVLRPGGVFEYEGPQTIENFPDHMQMSHKEVIDKSEAAGPWAKQKFTRQVVPDAATSDDADPRFVSGQESMLPPDSLTAIEAVSYADADDNTSGKGNLLHGYPSQGALMKEKIPGVVYLGEDNTGAVSKSRFIPIAKFQKYKQIIYCVVLSPNEADLQEDIMSAEDIEEAAHNYLLNARVVGSGHSKAIDAGVVESYIAPEDFETNGQLGPQTVKKGSWIIGIKIRDPKEWAKVLSGEYTGVSVGGFGSRTPVN